MSTGKDIPDPPTDESLSNEMSDDEIAEAEAAVTLATLPEDERLPAHVRARIEASAKALLGNRAKVHALKRAGEREGGRVALEGMKSPARGLQSTTSAGSHVVEASEEHAAARPTPLFVWGGWALAAAAAIALFVSRSASTPRPAEGGSLGAVASPVDRVALHGADGAVGELQYDRSTGTGVVKLERSPKTDPQRSALQLWVAFEGDATPRGVALLGSSAAELPFGAGSRLCQGAPPGAPSAPRCIAIRDVVLTWEERGGTLVLDPGRVVLRGTRSP